MLASDSGSPSGRGSASYSEPYSDALGFRLESPIPILGKAQLGELLFTRASKTNDLRKPASGRWLLQPYNGNRIVFYCDVGEHWDANSIKKDLDPWLAAFAAVRHEQFQTAYGPGSTLLLSRVSHKTLGVARTFALVNGDTEVLEIPTEIRWGIVKRFSIATKDGFRDVQDFGRNEPCPCGSGSKYKKCHLRSSRM